MLLADSEEDLQLAGVSLFVLGAIRGDDLSDFHSTNENVFYPINEEVITGIDNFTQRWFPFVTEANPELNLRSEEFEPNSPIAKNWVYKTFGTDALTFEVEDELSEEAMQSLGHSAAESLMKLLLEELAAAEQ